MTQSYVQLHLCESQSRYSVKELINIDILVFAREIARKIQHHCARMTVWQREG